jgi:hypothetical protein
VQTRRLEASRTAAAEQLLVIQTEVAVLEQEQGINPRWVPGCAEWEAAAKREAIDHYYKALRELECLVVQRIAELEKMGSVGLGKSLTYHWVIVVWFNHLGYKTHTHMSKGIKAQERTIHGALDRYNKAALALDPPRPSLSFKELTEFAYLANFDFLKYSEHGAQNAEWSRPVNRRCVELWQRIERAKEEIFRLNIEVRWVSTHIHDEEMFLREHHTSLNSCNSSLGHELSTRLQLIIQTNQHIMRDLEAISKLKGFSGDITPGIRNSPAATESDPCDDLPPDVPQSTGNNLVDTLIALEDNTSLDSEGDEVEPSDEAQGTMTAVEECCTYQ